MPAQPGPLIGRTAELALIRARLADDGARLLTLTGAAGTGKTRLAVEVAGLSADAFGDGAYFVDLAPISDASLVASAIAQTIDVREERDRGLIEVLTDALGERRILLLLDNFEQVLGAAPQLSDLLKCCPHLKLLVTSRSALRLRWEHVIPVRPLAVPDVSSPQSAEALADSPAVKLFVQRAQRVDAHFALTEANANAIAAICVRLDGLPLAIELAAARTRVLPPEALLSRLGDRLNLLAEPTLDQPLRQRTLRAALDWSYDLLSQPEQRLFRRLGVFVGGFSLSAVSEVCNPGDELGFDTLAGVESLLAKSLIRGESTSIGKGEPRFGMLETIREYVVGQLAESGERDVMRHRHARYYLGDADVPVAKMRMSQQSMWLQSLEAEHENLRAALAWCEEANVPELGLSAASLLAWFWILRGYVDEGRRRLTALLALASKAPRELRSDALRVIGSLALHQADYATARASFDECLSIRRAIGEPAGLFSPLSSLGAVAMQQGELELAEAYFSEALAIQESIGDLVGVAESTNSLANIAHERGDLQRARDLYERSLVVQNTELRYRPDVVLHNLGIVAQEQGDLSGARQHFQDSVALKRAVGDTAGLALSLAKLGEVLSSMGDAPAAYHLLCESLTLQRESGDRPGIAFVLERFAMAAVTRNRAEQGLRFAAAAEALRDAIGAPLGPAAKAGAERWLAPARRALRPDLAAAAWQAGRAMSMDAVLAEVSKASPTRESHASEAGPFGQLTTREREVAVLVAEGLTNRDIAERLVVSERTAENHVQHVLSRLGLRSRAQVAAWAVQHGLAAEAR